MPELDGEAPKDLRDSRGPLDRDRVSSFIRSYSWIDAGNDRSQINENAEEEEKEIKKEDETIMGFLDKAQEQHGPDSALYIRYSISAYSRCICS